MANLQFDLVQLTALAVDTPASAVGLSGMSLQLILAAAEVLEDHSNWFGAGDTLTDVETDAIDAAVSLMESEIMSALNLGTMSTQDDTAVDINGGTIDGITRLNTGLLTGDPTLEQEGSPLRLIVNSYHTQGSSLDLAQARGTKAAPEYMDNNDFQDVRFRTYDEAVGFYNTYAYIRAQAAENFASTARGSKLMFATTALGTTTTSVKLQLHENGRLEIDGDLDHDGSNVGFYNTTPIAKPTVTGSRGGNAAVASLLTALASLGLIINSSTP